LGSLVFYSNMPAHYVVNFKIDRALTEPRWISASVTSFSPRHDKVALSIISYSLLSSRGRSPWRSTVNQWAEETNPYASHRATMDCRVVHSALLAMTNCLNFIVSA
jgi:hypothetical protein